MAGRRRQLVDLIHETNDGHNTNELVHWERLSDEDARTLIDTAARRYQIEINEPTRDLIAQQLNASPFFINALLHASRESKTPLTSFLICQRLYVDELMGGLIHRHYSRILDWAVSNPQSKKAPLRVGF